jgi:hypothetical protein
VLVVCSISVAWYGTSTTGKIMSAAEPSNPVQGLLRLPAPINDFAFVQHSESSESRVRRATTIDTADASTDGQGEPPAADPEEAAEAEGTTQAGSNSGDPDCIHWNCSCQYLSDFYRIEPGRWGEAVRMTNVKSWWGEQKCTTKPDIDLPPRDASVVSILTFSNGQDHCNENALLNAMYQRRPEGISRIELVMTETSSAPSTQWLEWERVYVNSTFRVVYRWYNGSINSNTPRNPVLGTLRNLAARQVASGSVMINMDNDDVYHPDFVA